MIIYLYLKMFLNERCSCNMVQNVCFGDEIDVWFWVPSVLPVDRIGLSQSVVEERIFWLGNSLLVLLVLNFVIVVFVTAIVTATTTRLSAAWRLGWTCSIPGHLNLDWIDTIDKKLKQS